ncbi:MAG: Gfo/Idh/MocA family protein [Verrucomicrobiia bacterium]
MSELAIKIGIVGLDSSHAVQYAKLLHEADHSHHVSGGRIVAAYAGGSPDWELSHGRVAGFQEELENGYSIPVRATIEEVVAASDAIMILTIDGRVHLDQFRAVAASGKPVYIDKPLTATTADARQLAEIAESTSARVFSSSVWRYAVGLREALAEVAGPVRHMSLHGQWPVHPGLHGWAWYGIHQVELLYAALGVGCQRVSCARDGAAEVLTGFWSDGRIGTIATNHDEGLTYGGWVADAEGTHPIEVKDGMHDRYAAFLTSALAFYRGGPAPVALAETIETIAFMETAWRSREQGGVVLELPGGDA